jgi:hypothetical protein
MTVQYRGKPFSADALWRHVGHRVVAVRKSVVGALHCALKEGGVALWDGARRTVMRARSRILLLTRHSLLSGQAVEPTSLPTRGWPKLYISMPVLRSDSWRSNAQREARAAPRLWRDAWGEVWERRLKFDSLVEHTDTSPVPSDEDLVAGVSLEERADSLRPDMRGLGQSVPGEGGGQGATAPTQQTDFTSDCAAM